MQNTHITKPNQTHSTSKKISLSLLAIFFVCVLWGANPSQAMMNAPLIAPNPAQNGGPQVNANPAGQPLAEDGDNDAQHRQNLQEPASHVDELDPQAYFRNVSTYVHDQFAPYKGTVKKGVITAIAATILAAAGKGAWSLYASSSNAAAIPQAVMRPSKPEILPDTSALVPNDADWGTATDDLAPAFKAFFKLAWTAARKVVLPTAQVALQPAEPSGGAIVDPSSTAAENSYLSTIAKTVAEKAFSLLKEYPRTTLFSVAAIGAGIWWKLSKKKPSARTIKDFGLGWGLAPLMSSVLAPNIAPFFNVLGGPACFAGRLLFDMTPASTAVKAFVADNVEDLLPNRDTVEDLVDWVVPDWLGKNDLRNLIHNNWGSGDRNNGNNARGAAESIGRWTSDTIAGVITLVALLLIFKLWELYQKAFSNHPHEAKKAPQANVKQQKDKVDLSENLFLHIIHSLGMADTAYNLVDKVIKMLEEKIEKYTQHQKYKAPSTIEAMTHNVKHTWELVKGKFVPPSN